MRNKVHGNGQVVKVIQPLKAELIPPAMDLQDAEGDTNDLLTLSPQAADHPTPKDDAK